MIKFGWAIIDGVAHRTWEGKILCCITVTFDFLEKAPHGSPRCENCRAIMSRSKELHYSDDSTTPVCGYESIAPVFVAPRYQSLANWKHENRVTGMQRLCPDCASIRWAAENEARKEAGRLTPRERRELRGELLATYRDLSVQELRKIKRKLGIK